MTRATMWIAAAALAAIIPSVAEAQRRPARRQQAIEIRGQVPTPQVVTVRPREVPAYSRQVLVPNFYDHDFWPAILQPYQMVPQRMITGVSVVDSAMRADSASAAPPMPGDTTRARPAGTTPPADTIGRASGTAPARPPRR